MSMEGEVLPFDVLFPRSKEVALEASGSQGKQQGKGQREEFVTLKIPESIGGSDEVVQFPIDSFVLINEYLLSTGHEYLSTGTDAQQRAIAQWQGLMPNAQRAEAGSGSKS